MCVYGDTTMRCPYSEQICFFRFFLCILSSVSHSNALPLLLVRSYALAWYLLFLLDPFACLYPGFSFFLCFASFPIIVQSKTCLLRREDAIARSSTRGVCNCPRTPFGSAYSSAPSRLGRLMRSHQRSHASTTRTTVTTGTKVVLSEHYCAKSKIYSMQALLRQE